MDRAKEDGAFPMRRRIIRVASPALVCVDTCRFVLTAFVYAIGARIQRKYVPIRALVSCPELANADSREGRDARWTRERRTIRSMMRSWESLRLWPEEVQHRVGLPVRLEYEPDQCGDAFAVALGPCHPSGTSEVPTSSFKGWSCLECEKACENGDLTTDSEP